MKLTKNLDLRELVPKSVWTRHGGRAVRMVDAQLILAVQEIVGRRGWTSVTINDWLWGGGSEQRGLRIPGQPLYRGDGAHDWGRALDLVPRRGSERVEDLVREFHEMAATYPGRIKDLGIWRIETIDLAPTWIHIDSVFSANQQKVAFIDMTRRFSPEEYADSILRNNIPKA